jgi:hypothetical protein
MWVIVAFASDRLFGFDIVRISFAVRTVHEIRVHGLSVGDHEYSRMERKKDVGTPYFLWDIVEEIICLL